MCAEPVQRTSLPLGEREFTPCFLLLVCLLVLVGLLLLVCVLLFVCLFFVVCLFVVVAVVDRPEVTVYD